MFLNLKEIIKELAYSAVNMAEQTLGTEQGQKKKEMAIEFVVSRIPIMKPFKSIIVLFLSKFIDEAIEQAVMYMNNVQNERDYC